MRCSASRIAGGLLASRSAADKPAASWRRCAPILALLAVAPTTFANDYALIDLGPYRRPEAISSDGQVAAYFSKQDSARPLVRRNEHWHRLAEVGFAWAINDDGIVGGQRSGAPATWSPDRLRHTFELPHGAQKGIVTGLSKDWAAGFYASQGSFRCFRGPALGGDAEDLVGLADSRYCSVNDTNAAGQIVGEYDDGHLRRHAFLWEDGRVTDLGTLSNANNSRALGINNQGHVVGMSGRDSTQHAVTWINGAIAKLGDSARFSGTQATAINDAGVVVGIGMEPGGQPHAVRFESGKVIELAKETTGAARWNLYYAVGINQSGVIIGWGKHGGRFHGFMLVPNPTRPGPP